MQCRRGATDIKSISKILNAVRAKGITDIKNAYKYDGNSNEQEAQILKELLGIDRGEGEDNGYLLSSAVFILYSSFADDWEIPELKANFIEKLDNGSEIWQIQDFQTMQQARLVKSEDGGLNIGNVERFSTEQKN